MSRTIVTCPFPRIPSLLPANALVATPHGPAARALRRPRVTLQSIARKILALNDIFAADPQTAAKLLREAAAEVYPKMEAAAAARRVAPMLSTILRVGMDTGRLKEHGSRRARELAEVAEVYREKLRAKRLVHSDELVWEAANVSPEKQELIIYGYTRARKEEIVFINRIAGEGSVYYLPVIDGNNTFKANSEYVRQMEDWGWTVDAGESQPETTGERSAARFLGLQEDIPDGAAAYSLHDVGSETRFVLGEVKKLLRSGTPAGEIAIVVRDLNLYAKEFALIGTEYGVPTMSSLRIPLSETLIGGLVNLLISVITRDFDFEETVRLLGHPFGPGMSEETWKNSRRSRTKTYEKWAALERSLECLTDIRCGETRTFSRWFDCLNSVLKAFDVRRRAGHSAREIVAYNCLRDELAFIASDETEGGFADFAVAVRDILGHVTTHFDPSRLGVLVTDPNTVVGGRFQHLYVMGMAEGVLPVLPSDSPVIDFHERRSLAKEGFEFEEAADIPRWEALSFFSLLSTATRSLTLTFPSTIGKEEKLRSSFFDRLGITPTAALPNVLSSEAEVTRNTLRKAAVAADSNDEAGRRQLVIELSRESAARHDEYDGNIGEAIDTAGRVWSVSQLTTLAGCGFKWLAKYGFKINTADEMDLDVTHAARGKLFHFALHYAVAAGGARSQGEIIELLDHALAAGYEDPDVAMPRIENWDMRRAEYTAQLTRAVEAGDFLPQGCEIAATEKEFRVSMHGLVVRGRIDRVDRTPEGLIAVDYKYGKDKPKLVRDRAGRKLDLQLAVYLAAMKSLYPNEPVGEGIYYSISGCKSYRTDLSDEIVLREFIESTVDAPRTGTLSVRPLSKDICTYCDYDQLCRKGARLQRKEAGA